MDENAAAQARRLLWEYGHSTHKATEIVVDARLGDGFSEGYITFVKSQPRDKQHFPRMDEAPS